MVGTDDVSNSQHPLERSGGRATVGGQCIGDLRTTVTELGTRTTRLHDGENDTEGLDFLRHRLTETLNPPLACVIERVPWEGGLATVGRHLDDTSATVCAHRRKQGVDELDGCRQIGVEDALDLLVGEFLAGDRAVDDGAQRRGIADVEHLGAERIPVCFDDVLDRIWIAHGSDDTLTAYQQLPGEVKDAADPITNVQNQAKKARADLDANIKAANAKTQASVKKAGADVEKSVKKTAATLNKIAKDGQDQIKKTVAGVQKTVHDAAKNVSDAAKNAADKKPAPAKKSNDE
ncbi:MAG: hypothetical protein QOI01_4667 [Mycobacterium sp.]|nr:hypothetical protein [Mycobacterium sp.]